MTVPAHGIEVENEAGYPVNSGKLAAAAQAVMGQQGTDPVSGLTVLIADDDTVRDLNRAFRHVNSVTDVLSFPAQPLPQELAAKMNEAPYLGDLILAYPFASAQAQALGHAVDDSLALLVIHGTLHLLGYDHNTPENRDKMWAAQDAALTALGISTAIVPGLEDASHDG